MQSINPEHMTKVVGKVLDWIHDNFQAVLSNKVYGVQADIQNRLILMGHSAAGHIVTQYLNDSCGDVKMQILLDPVDGVDPFGIKNDFIITPGKLLPYAVPVLVVATELDSAKRET